MAPAEDRSSLSKEPLMMDHDGRLESGNLTWSLSEGYPQSTHEPKASSRRRVIFYLVTVLPWGLLILFGSWSWIHHLQTREFNPSQLVYSQCSVFWITLFTKLP